MRVHYLQHVPFEGLGSIEGWLQRAGHSISSTRFYCDDPLPATEEVDFLVIMGGPMSVNDEALYPWLVQEKSFVRQLISLGTPVLGICLGAQLIASAMGGEVYPNRVKEIGWFPIQAIPSRAADLFHFPDQSTVFHWHGETFQLPTGAIPLAKSQGCEHQAFQLGRHVIGLQFHLETTPASAQAIVDHCRDELVTGDYIQSEAEILAAPAERYSAINRLMAGVLTYLTSAKG